MMKYGTCPFCGRTDVPLCDNCGQRVPHGTTPGTWLPCACRGTGSSDSDIMRNVMEEWKERQRKEVNGK